MTQQMLNKFERYFQQLFETPPLYLLELSVS